MNRSRFKSSTNFGLDSEKIGIVSDHMKQTMCLNNEVYCSFPVSVLSPVVVLLYMAAKYFPLFACMDAPIPLVGHILGLIYSCFL